MFWVNGRKYLVEHKISVLLRLVFLVVAVFIAYAGGLFAATVVDFFTSKQSAFTFAEYQTAYSLKQSPNRQMLFYKEPIIGNLFGTLDAPSDLFENKNLVVADLDQYSLHSVFVWVNKSMALLKKNNEQALLEVGENFPDSDVKLVEVRRDEAKIQSGPAEKWLAIKPVGVVKKAATSSSQQTAAAPNYDVQNQGGIRQLEASGGRQEILLSQERVEHELKNFAQLLNQARVIPKFTNGKPDGYEIKNIVPGSIYEQLGLRNQDAIQAVNGEIIDSPEKALELFKLLRNEKQIQLDITRNGSPLNLIFNIN